MVEKKAPAEGWPIVSGDYVVGDQESPVAAVTLASHIEDVPHEAGAAIAGPCKTENIGIEKVIANIVSNPNIRFLVLCGSEVQGHIVGQSMAALYENGVDPEQNRRIIGADGAIPYIENIPDEGIERFQKQVELFNMIDVEDPGQIQAKVKECIEKDPGAFEEEPMVIEVEEEEEEEVSEEIRPVAAETALIEARMRNIQTQVKMIGSINRMFAGMYAGKVQGIMIGLAFTLILGFLLMR